MISIDQIKQLREETAVSIMECKKALAESNGDFEKARDILRKWGKEIAKKKGQERTAGQGMIASYIHPNKKIGVLLVIKCESDFVVKSESFQELSHEICLQIAAMNPLFVKEEEISEDILTKEKEIYLEQIKDSGKPREIVEQIIAGKIDKYKKEVCLMSQPWVKDSNKTVEDLLNEYISKIGEKIIIEKFTRYEL